MALNRRRVLTWHKIPISVRLKAFVFKGHERVLQSILFMWPKIPSDDKLKAHVGKRKL